MTIFTKEQLRDFLRYAPDDEFSVASAQQVHDVAAGWIADAADVDDLTELIPGQPSQRVRAWAIELAAIAYENPTTADTDAAAESSSGWGRVDRRQQILDNVRAWAQAKSGAGAVPLPRGQFPKARRWPDGWCR